ncbi:DMT family transporter [Salinibacterium soli]|uniref:DMT family transporter n=1 Tax=Antiquaquibacter soli TaxID=3064523 RepID=A0ABT9BNB7_9MICO|nr:DMT family transporter [Protaetiibacter sp. WY-16]MDO7882510.1 DMT family transporter [Protaetiibacter sp. WY-16]
MTTSTAPARVTPIVLVAIAVTIVAWASAFIVIRGTAGHFSGGALALGRLAVGTLLLGIVVLLGRRWVWPNRTEWLQLLGFGVLWFGAYNVALNIAEQTIDAGTTAMIVNIGPILIALGAAVFLREGLSTWLAIGAAVAFVGVILIGVATGGTSFTDPGVLWALVAAVTYAAGVLLQKPTLRRLPNAQVTWMGCAIGFLVCLPFTADLVRDVQSAPPSALLGVVYLGAIPTALAFSTWAFALSRMPAGQLGVSTYIVPPLAIVMGLLFFAEVPAPLAILGGAVCLLGVALSRRKPRTKATTA